MSVALVCWCVIGTWPHRLIAVRNAIHTAYTQPFPPPISRPTTDQSRDKIPWRAWQYFAARYLENGRIVDHTFGQKTTSEGQAYGLFFALVANDTQHFDEILDWTSKNLCQGRLGEQLPAWWWGEFDDHHWGVKDPNAAADADLWIAYSLLEAARLWHRPELQQHGLHLLDRISEQEVVTLENHHHLLLPGPVGFRLENNRYTIDPSYLPGFLLQALADAQPQGPWPDIWQEHLALASSLYAHGIAPDTATISADGGVESLPGQVAIGSYDAIRIYLWAGMSGPSNAALRESLKGFVQEMRETGAPPERMDSRTGTRLSGPFSPIGFSGAMLPYLHSTGEYALLDQTIERINHSRWKILLGQPRNYYDDALILFGSGWLEHVYQFDANGHLQPAWQPK